MRRPVLLLSATLVALSSSPALGAPSLRQDGRTVRFAAPTVTAATTTTLQGDLVELSHGPERYLLERPSGELVPVDFGDVELPEAALDNPVTATVTDAGEVRRATLDTSPRSTTGPVSAHRAYVAKVGNRGTLDNGDGTTATDAQIGALVDTALARWQEESNGAISSFTRVDLRTFSTASDCSSGSTLYNEAATNAYPGVSFSSTSGNHLIVVGGTSCGGGIGTVGTSIASGGRLNFNWSPTKNLHTLLHELGHNLSLGHAHACTDSLPGCASVGEYGNLYAIMGATVVADPPFTPAALDSFERARLGIADPDEIADVRLPAGRRTVRATYDLRARGTAAGLRGLRLVDPVGGAVRFVDWRSGGARDALSYYASSLATFQTRIPNPGITVEQVEADGRTATLQAYPKANPAAGDVFGLTAGRSFTRGGTTVTAVALGTPGDPGSTARVEVALTDPTVAPDTAIVAGPDEGATILDPSPVLRFGPDPAEPGLQLDCRLDDAAWAPCTSPLTLPELADGLHVFRVRARDGDTLLDDSPAVRTFAVLRGAPAPAEDTAAPAEPSPAAATPTTVPAIPVTATPATAVPAAARRPAKLTVRRASLSAARRRLVVVAPISARASGAVRVTLRAAGRTLRFRAPVVPARGRVTIRRTVGPAIARARTATLTLAYAGDADTAPQTVTVRLPLRPGR